MMAPLRLQTFWMFCGWLMAAVIIVLSLIPVSQVGPSDKLNHLIAYFTLMAWFGALYPRRRHAYVLCAVVSLGIVIEGLQGLTSWRDMSLLDIGANTLGAVIACLLIRDYLRPLLGWFELHLLPHRA